MTKEDLAKRYPNFPEPAIMALLDLFYCYQEVKEGAKRAAEDGVVCWWPPVSGRDPSLLSG